MSPGTFLFDDNFVFHDGNVGRKIFVVLCDGTEGVYLAAKVTSNGTRYKNDHGCQSNHRFPAYFLVAGSCCLQENTWVQLDSFYEFDAQDLMQRTIRGELNLLGLLGATTAIDLLQCAQKCQDISQYQAELVQSALDDLS